MTDWDETCDLAIVGSGGGSVCAALAAKRHHKSAIILEKQALFGGSTGFSGGVWWVPNNHLMERDGIPDSHERGRQYLDAAVGAHSIASTPARREAFLTYAREVLVFLEQHGMQLQRVAYWPDYYDELPGGEKTSRSVVAPLFDLRELGEWAARLSVYKGLPLPANSDEFTDILLVKRTWAGKRKMLQVGWRMLLQALTGRRLKGTGGAVQGRLLQIALREQIPVWLESKAAELIVEGDRVIGLVVERNGRPVRVRARDGVLINVGGFSRSLALRERFQPQPTSTAWTSANPGDTGEMIEAAMGLGAAIDCMEEAWWVVTSMGPDDVLPEGARAADGTAIPFMHHLDLAKPHLLLVDQDGRRFADESGAYMEIGQRMYARERETGRAVPSWVIMDSRNRSRYTWGTAAPGHTPKQWLDSGYMKRAATLEGLAAQCGIDAAGLQRTVERFNAFAASGRDEDFGRGSREFDRRNGDPTNKPNPCLGAIDKPPFMACAIYPGDVGTAGGLVTDEHARVLRADGSVIDGLYATGNCTASVMGRCYPGAGASIAASFAFGYVAANHACAAAASTRSTPQEQNA